MTLCAVNRNTGSAVYLQIAQILEEEIKAIYVAGDYLPTEKELALRFSVNRHTLWHAIDEVVDMGLIDADSKFPVKYSVTRFRSDRVQLFFTASPFKLIGVYLK